jgi:hypothetical protein
MASTGVVHHQETDTIQISRCDKNYMPGTTFYEISLDLSN